MAFKLVKRNKLRVPVKGTLKDEDGKTVNFDFTLLCDRLSQAEIESTVRNSDEPVKEFVQRVTNDWDAVLDEAGQPLPFDPVNLDAVLDQAGMAIVCYQSYLKEVGAVVKN